MIQGMDRELQLAPSCRQPGFRGELKLAVHSGPMPLHPG
ncbi:hypothetical protein Hhel01_01705 [Haloferula helveola]